MLEMLTAPEIDLSLVSEECVNGCVQLFKLLVQVCAGGVCECVNACAHAFVRAHVLLVCRGKFSHVVSGQRALGSPPAPR